VVIAAAAAAAVIAAAVVIVADIIATSNTYMTGCCEQVRHAAAVQYGIHELHIAYLYTVGVAGGGGRFLKAHCKLLQQMLNKYLKIEPQAHWFLLYL